MRHQEKSDSCWCSKGRPRWPSWQPARARKQPASLGVCLATSGPGAIHLLNGLYDAKLDHAPVLAITGMRETQMLGTGYQQVKRSPLEKLSAMDVSVYNEMIRVPVQATTLVDLADASSASADEGRRPPHDPDRHPDRRRRRQPVGSTVAPAVIKPTAPIFIEARRSRRPAF